MRTVSAVVGLQSCGEIFGETGVVMEWFVYRLEDVDVVKSQAIPHWPLKIPEASLGESGGQNHLKILDSRLCGNDVNWQ